MTAVRPRYAEMIYHFNLNNHMKVRRDILSRIVKKTVKSELHTPFIQGEYEYITNAFFMVKVPKKPEQKEDGRNLPQMDVAERVADTGKEDFVCFDIEYLIDALVVMKDNGTKYVDIKMGRQGARISGKAFYMDESIAASSLVMAVIKK